MDPRLDPNGLQDNGGSTLTIALLPDSPALDQATSVTIDGMTLTTDQRGVGFPRTFDDPAIANADGGDGTDIGAFEGAVAQQLAVLSAVSRKTHGTAGTFDVVLPLSGDISVECRTGGAAGIYQIVVTFSSPVIVASAVATPDPNAPGATGTVSDFTINGTEVTVNLTDVSNAQTIGISLFGVSDGTSSLDVTIPMGVLEGDTTGDGVVARDDVQQVKTELRQTVDSSNFREDVTLSGTIRHDDTATVRQQKGTKLP